MNINRKSLLYYSVNAKANEDKTRAITRTVIDCFIAGKPKTIGNSKTDGITLYMWDKPVAKFVGESLYIRSLDMQTSTVYNRLNGLLRTLNKPTIVQKDFEWFINGELWDGNWIKI